MIQSEIVWKARIRHAQHYLKQLQLANYLYLGGSNQAQQGIILVQSEWMQIKQAQFWLSQHSSKSEMLAEMCSAYAHVSLDLLDLVQDVEEQIHWYEEALQSAIQINSRRSQGHHLMQLGLLSIQQGEDQKALSLLQESEHILQKIETQEAIIRVCNCIGDVHQIMGDKDQAKQYYEQSISLSDSETENFADSLLGLGKVALLDNKFDKGKQYIERSLNIYEMLDKRRKIAEALNSLGEIACSMGEIQSAYDYHQRSLRAFEYLENKRGIATALARLGAVTYNLGDYINSESYCDKSLQIWRHLGDPRETAITLLLLGDTLSAKGSYNKAEQYYQESLVISEKLNDKTGMAMLLVRLGHINSRHKKFPKSRNNYQQSLEIFEALDDLWGISMSNFYLGQIALQQNLYVDAKQHFSQTLNICQDIKDSRGVINALIGLGNTQLENGNYELASQHFQIAYQTALQIEAVPMLLSVLTGVGKLRQKQNKFDMALEIWCFILHHPSTSQEIKDTAKEELFALRAVLEPDKIQNALKHGRLKAQKSEQDWKSLFNIRD